MKAAKQCLVILCALLIFTSCGGGDDMSEVTPQNQANLAQSGGPFTVASPGVVFGAMDAAYGARGDVNTSLPLAFYNAPEGTKSYALLLEDPDSVDVVGYVCVHWMAANITAEALPDGASLDLQDQMVQGANYLGTAGYTGPAPPDGSTHTYVLAVWALDTLLDLDNGFDRAALETAMQGHVLGSAELTGDYSNG